jgi:WD40 repeat protein
MSFLPDPKSIIVCLNGPDTRILVYRWSIKSSTGRQYKLIASKDFHKTEISKVSIHPLDRSLLTTSGTGMLKQWNIEDGGGSIEPYQMEITGLPAGEFSFSDHIWTEERQLVACTRQGDVFIL